MCGSLMSKVQVEVSQGLKFDNLKKWDDSGFDIKKLPNSEWFNESYIRTDWLCQNCFYREYGEEISCRLIRSNDF